MARKVVGEDFSEVKNDLIDTVEGNSDEEELKNIIVNFFDVDSRAKELSNKANSLKAKIKEIMLNNNLTTFDFDSYKANCSVIEMCKFDDDILLACVKDAGKKELIKIKEYVDHDDLEAAIYKGQLDASVLAPAQKLTEQVRLQVTMKKRK